MKKILFIIFATGYLMVLSAQTDSTGIITPSESPRYNHNLMLFNDYRSPLYSPLTDIPEFDYSQIYFEEYPEADLTEKQKIDLMLSKAEFYKALGKFPEFTEKNDLGFLGDVLMYTNAAATMYLLYKHVDKYGFK